MMGKSITKTGILEHSKSSLRQMPLLKSVSKETLRQIEQGAKQLSFAKGQEIISRSDEITDVYVLTSGLARVSVFSASGKAVNFRRVDPGDIFGEFAAIDGERRSATVEVVEACRVICISAALFRDLMEADPAFMNAVLVHLVAQLRALTAFKFSIYTAALAATILLPPASEFG
jgi:CRP-like cAMP-binding protein